MLSLSVTDFVGNVAVVTTILQFLSGILVCKQYVTQRTTGDASPLPFLSCVLSASLWCMYGLAKKDGKIIFVNTVGIALMMLYTVIFYIYSPKKRVVAKQFVAMALLLFFTTLYALYEKDKEALLRNTGYLASILTLLTIVSPMSKLFYVIKVKNTECLPFPLIVMSFFVSILWSCYGLLCGDIFIMAVNIIGTCLAVLQLFLFVIYPSSGKALLLPKTVNVRSL